MTLKIIKSRGQFLILLFLTILGSSCTKDEPHGKNTPTVFIKEIKGKLELIRNGEPFYIKGAASHRDYLAELEAAGANTARIYDTTDLRPVLDKAHELGLAVAVDIPLPKFDRSPEFYEDEQMFSVIYQNVQRLVEDYKDHPALLYWNLGNEIYYPYLYRSTPFYKNYNSLIDLIHQLDPNHPVSTSTIGANKLKVVSIKLRSPQLDFISFNSFGVLSQFSAKLKPIAPFWNGPHTITEWGVNGPWEAQLTSWGAPIEETSTKKAEQIVERHSRYIQPLRNNNSFGTFVFYWGQKNEVTPTWYSLFEQDLKSEAVFRLKEIWNEMKGHYPGPKLNYILLNSKGAGESIILSPGEKAKAEIFFPNIPDSSYSYSWEVREESWYGSHISKILAPVNFEVEQSTLTFQTPRLPGAYRLHLMITNNTGYYASANIPFYVLNPSHEE